MLGKRQRKGNPSTLLVGLEIGAANYTVIILLGLTVMLQYGGPSKKLNIKQSYGPTIPYLGAYLKKRKTLI